MKTTRMTGEAWAKHFGIRVIDEDGWEPRTKFYTSSINECQFLRKIVHSTCQFPRSKEFDARMASYLANS